MHTTFTLRIRVKNSADAVQYTSKPYMAYSGSATFSGVTVLDVWYEPEVVERESVDYKRRPAYIGARAMVHIEFVAIGLAAVGGDGSGGLVGLSTTLASMFTSGNYFEISFDNGSNYKRVNLLNMKQSNLDGKDVGMKLVLDFEGADLQTSNVEGYSNSAW